jgi:serine/threonine protein phosphatase 1
VSGPTYAIGDVHGRHDLLVRMLAEIARHAAGRAHKIVCLGDYIDRGPDSAAVVATLMALQAERPQDVVCLLGNHESMLLNALADFKASTLWVMNGGDTTLASFGVAAPRAVPAAVVAWLTSLPAAHEDVLRYYVHAGFRPGRRMDKQTHQDMLWIRAPFLDRDYDFGKHVVHGHTPLQTGQPDVHPFRTNLDTGAVFGGPLTAGIFGARKAPAVDFLAVA